jgi:CheY-like chemotaxis protein
MLDLIFRPGFSTTERVTQFSGRGVGMDVVRTNIMKIGGTVDLESEPGRGSTFFFRVLFAAPAAPAGTTAAPVAAPIPVSDRPIRILLAEDAEDNRSIIALFLRAVPHELTIAENGEQAVAAFAPGKFDVILMDNQMPVMDGLTAVRQIRTLEREAGKPPTRILALTADCDGHLTKPIRRDVLVQAVRSAT